MSDPDHPDNHGSDREDAAVREWIKHQQVMAYIARAVPPLEWTDRGPVRAEPAVPAGEERPLAFYINMDEKTDRRASIEYELGRIHVPFQRIPAVKGVYAPLGILKSHLRALAAAEATQRPWVLIMEDDFVLAQPPQVVIERINWMSERIDEAPMWLGDWVHNGPKPPRHAQHSWLSRANGACNCASCYVVRRDYVPVLRHTWETATKNLVTDLRRLTQSKRNGEIESIRSQVWVYDADAAWAPLQERDGWLLFDPVLGRQARKRFASDNVESYEIFETSGYLRLDLDAIETET